MKSLAVTTAMFTVLVFCSPAALARPDTTPAAAPAFDGSVGAMAHSNRHFYIGGEFTTVQRGNEKLDRHHLAAVSQQGDLTDFAPDVDGPVTAMSSDSQYLYVAGEFSTVDGRRQARLARFDQGSGAFDTSFRPKIEGTVHQLETYGKRLYIGGDLGARNLVAVDTTDGAESTEFTPTLDGPVYALHATESRLYIGGEFSELNGESASRLAALRPSSGTLDPEFNPKVRQPVHAIIESGEHVYTASGGRLDALSHKGSRDWSHVADGAITELSTHDGELYAAGDFQQLCQDPAASAYADCQDAQPRRGVFATSFTGDVTEWKIAPTTPVTALASSPRQLAVGTETAASGAAQHSPDGFALFS